MNILYICKLLSSKGNGVVSALINEVKIMQKKANVAVYCLGTDISSDQIDTIYKITEYGDFNNLPSPYNNPDLIVFEEIYKIEYLKLYKKCLMNNIPYIIIPHGSLVKEAQSSKHLKHIIANILFFNRFISNASAIQFLNEMEKQKSNFRYKKAIIIPNGIEIPKIIQKRTNKYFDYIFIGRYNIFVKGLDFLVEGFINLKSWCKKNKVRLLLFGITENEEEFINLKAKITNCECDDYIIINGPIFDKEKAKRIHDSAVFIQTSRHEAQPMSIIEALSYGLPCLVTYNTSFGEDCNRYKFGIGIDFSLLELEKAVQKIFNDKDYYMDCKKNAIEYVKSNFEITYVTDKTLAIYKTVIKGYKK